MTENTVGVSKPSNEFSLDAGIRMMKDVPGPDLAELITFLEESEAGEPREVSEEEMKEFDKWVTDAKKI